LQTQDQVVAELLVLEQAVLEQAVQAGQELSSSATHLIYFLRHQQLDHQKHTLPVSIGCINSWHLEQSHSEVIWQQVSSL